VLAGRRPRGKSAADVGRGHQVALRALSLAIRGRLPLRGQRSPATGATRSVLALANLRPLKIISASDFRKISF